MDPHGDADVGLAACAERVRDGPAIQCLGGQGSSGVLVGTLASIGTVTALLWLISENKLPVW